MTPAGLFLSMHSELPLERKCHFSGPGFFLLLGMVGTVGTVGTSHLFAERVTISIKRHHSLFIGVKCVHKK